MESLDRTRLDPGQPPGSRPATEPPQELRRLGEYRILRRLGEGGMGAVYLGYHEAESKQFALKVLNDQLASSQAYIDRFYREARSGVLLSHPNLVRCFGAGQDATTGKHYLILEYVDGPSTLAILEQHGKLSVGDAVHIALDVARALEHAHSRNIIHRDIKPDNILITRSGVSKLADLGLAKRTDEASHLTAARQGFGTSYYMPYEQAVNARQADGRSDIYALGATLYHLLTGEVPFRGETHLDVVEKKDLGAFTAAVERNPAVPPVLDQILAKMLARQPRDRYQTASEVIIDLERSRLAAPVPSYADPDLALQDPWVRACLATSAQPTQPDLAVADRVETPLSPAEDDESSGELLWIIRFKPHDGRWRRVRMSESQLRQRLQEGRVPADAEICSDPREGFHPLSADPLFGPLLAEHAARTPPRRGRNPARPETPRAEGPLPRPSWPLIVAVGLTSLLVGGLGLLAFLLLKNP